jgi:hypothetical protein
MSDKEKKETTTTTSQPPGSLLGDLIAGGKSLLGRKKRMADIDKIDADSGNPCHYQTHVGDKQGMNRQGRSKGKGSCHHGR